MDSNCFCINKVRLFGFLWYVTCNMYRTDVNQTCPRCKKPAKELQSGIVLLSGRQSRTSK